MTAAATTLPGLCVGDDGTTTQLYRYAEDLQALLDSHVSLEERHDLLNQAFERNSVTLEALQSLLKDSNDLFIVTDGRGQIRQANQRARRLLGEALEGMYLRSFVSRPSHPDFDRLQAAKALNVHSTDRSVPELTLLTLGGWHLIVEVVAQQSQPDGASTLVYWVLRDTTHIHQAGLESQLAMMVYNSATEGIMITDLTGRIIAANPAFLEITAYPLGELVGKEPTIFGSGVHGPELFEGIWKTLREQGAWQGQIYNRKKSGEIVLHQVTFNTAVDRFGQTQNYIGIFTDLSKLDSAEQRISFLAYHDPLTGLPNRALLMDRLGQAIAHASRGQYGFTLLFIDLDRFKPINDSLGHAAGDIVLKEVAERLLTSVRDVDTVARLGGDEFVILAPGMTLGEHIEKFALKVGEALSVPIPCQDRELSIGCSIGAASFPDDGGDVETLIRHADMAMYHSKQNGGNGIVRYAQISGSDDTGAQLSLESELRQALARRQLHLAYQPQVRAGAEPSVIGVEALLRWTHPTLGEVPPAIFIPIAERIGAIISIGAWAFREACSQLAVWQKCLSSDLRMAINISPRQLRDRAFISVVQSAIEEAGLEASDIEIEITEGVLMHQSDNGYQALFTLRQMGVTIAVDDFGTGYSSLSRLQTMPVHKLKIDRSFVCGLGSDCQAEAISSCIIQMAGTLGLDVVAEGVERDEQLHSLTERGCRYIQGYLFAKPMVPDEFEMWLRELATRASTISPGE